MKLLKIASIASQKLYVKAKQRLVASNMFKFNKTSNATVNRISKKQTILKEPESSDSDEEVASFQRQRSLTPALVDAMPEKITPASNGKLPTRRDSVNSNDSEMSSIFHAQPSRSSTPSSFSRPVTPTTFGRPVTPAFLRVKTQGILEQSNRSATPFMNQTGREQCHANTNKGARCKNAAIAGALKCRVHSLTTSEAKTVQS